MKGIEWRDIPGHENYMVNNIGEVYSKKSDRLMKQTHDTEGYLKVTIDGETCRVHRLVSIAFIPNGDNKKFVNHKNGKRDDNRAKNLEWVTNRENLLLAHRKRRNPGGYKSRRIVAVNRKTKVAKIFQTQAEAERETGVHNSRINKILHGKGKTGNGYEFYYVTEA